MDWGELPGFAVSTPAPTISTDIPSHIESIDRVESVLVGWNKAYD